MDDFEPIGDAAARVVDRLKVKREIERWPVTDRASWLARRQADVTASAIGALFGVHDYMTRFGLWGLKSGRVDTNPEETPAMQRGRLLEPVAVELLRERHPKWKIERGTEYFRDPAARIGATPDVIAVDPDRPGVGIIQIKTVEPRIYRQKWRTGGGDDFDAPVEPPLWIALQAATEMDLVPGATWAMVAPLVVGFGLDMPEIEIPETPGLMDRVREQVAEFWRVVESGEEPAPDYERDGEIIRRLYAVDDASVVDLSGDNAALALAAEDNELRAKLGELEKRRKVVRAELAHKIGPAALATYNGKPFATAKTVQRKGYEVAPTSYRNLQIKWSA